MFQSIVLAFVALLDSNLSHQPILPSKVQLTALCPHKVFHPQQANSTQTSVWKQEAAVALLTHACFFLKFSYQDFLLASPLLTLIEKSNFSFVLIFLLLPMGRSFSFSESEISCTWHFATCFSQSTKCHVYLSLFVKTNRFASYF